MMQEKRAHSPTTKEQEMPSPPKQQVKKPETAPVADRVQVDMPFKDAVKAALAKKTPVAGWPKQPSTKHPKGKT